MSDEESDTPTRDSLSSDGSSLNANSDSDRESYTDSAEPYFRRFSTNPDSDFDFESDIHKTEKSLKDIFPLNETLENAIAHGYFAEKCGGEVREVEKREVERYRAYKPFAALFTRILSALGEMQPPQRRHRRVAFIKTKREIYDEVLPFRRVGLVVHQGYEKRKYFCWPWVYAAWIVGNNWLDIRRRVHFVGRAMLARQKDRERVFVIACCQMDPGVQFYFYSRSGVVHTRTMYVRTELDLIARGIVALESLSAVKLGYEVFKTRTGSTWYRYLPADDAGPGRWWMVVDESQRRHIDQLQVVNRTPTKFWLETPPLSGELSSAGLRGLNEPVELDADISMLFVLPRVLERAVSSQWFSVACADQIAGWSDDARNAYFKFQDIFVKIASTARGYWAGTKRDLVFPAYFSGGLYSPFSPIGEIGIQGIENRQDWNKRDDVLAIWVVGSCWEDTRRRGRYAAHSLMEATNGSRPRTFILVIECLDRDRDDWDQPTPSSDPDPQICFAIYSASECHTRAFSVRNESDFNEIARVVAGLVVLNDRRVGYGVNGENWVTGLHFVGTPVGGRKARGKVQRAGGWVERHVYGLQRAQQQQQQQQKQKSKSSGSGGPPGQIINTEDLEDEFGYMLVPFCPDYDVDEDGLKDDRVLRTRRGWKVPHSGAALLKMLAEGQVRVGRA